MESSGPDIESEGMIHGGPTGDGGADRGRAGEIGERRGEPGLRSARQLRPVDLDLDLDLTLLGEPTGVRYPSSKLVGTGVDTPPLGVIVPVNGDETSLRSVDETLRGLY